MLGNAHMDEFDLVLKPSLLSELLVAQLTVVPLDAAPQSKVYSLIVKVEIPAAFEELVTGVTFAFVNAEVCNFYLRSKVRVVHESLGTPVVPLSQVDGFSVNLKVVLALEALPTRLALFPGN